MKPKLLLISPAPPPYSGQEKLTLLLLRSRLADAFDITHMDTGIKQTNNENRGVMTIGKGLQFVGQMLHLIREILRCRPDVAYVPLAQNRTGMIKYGFFILLLSFFRVPVCSHLGGAHFDHYYANESRLMQFFLHRVFKKIRTLIARGDGQRAQFRDVYDPENVRVIPIPYIMEQKDLPPSFAEPEQGRTVRILFLGLISKAKGALDLVEAAGQMQREGVQVRLTLAGEILRQEKNIMHVDSPADMEAVLRQMLRQMNLEKATSLPGFLDEAGKKKVFAEHDVFVFPSYSESGPFVVFEAIAHGLPVVATPVGILPEVFQHGRDMLFCEPGNADSIVKQLRTLLESPGLGRSLASNALECVQRNCSLESFEEKMIQACRATLGH